jgi:hypothetical protein
MKTPEKQTDQRGGFASGDLLGGSIKTLRIALGQKIPTWFRLRAWRWRRFALRLYQPLYSPLAGIPLLLLDVSVDERAQFRPFQPPASLRQKLAWKWVNLMARIGLMDDPIQIGLQVRCNDSTERETLEKERAVALASGLSYKTWQSA